MNGDGAIVHVAPEVVVLDVDVLGMWLHLVIGGNLKGTTVVFKNTTMNHWLEMW